MVGSDSRTDAEGNALSPEEIELLRAGDETATNTDTIMVIRVPSDGTSATAISIPRDTYVSTPALGNVKINGVYGLTKEARAEQLIADGRSPEDVEKLSTEAGRQALINAIDDLTGIAVDHYAEVGLLGFVLLTDAVGGVDVCLNAPVYDEFSGADFTAGRQTLGGADALSFVRQRHGLPRGDLDRITRQQAFMASFANKLLSAGTLSNPARLNELGGAVRRSVVLDDEWDVMGFATQMQGLTGGNVIFDTIPVTSIDGVGDHGESVVTVDKGQVHKYFEKLLDTDDESSTESEAPEAVNYDAAKVTVSVYNATFTDGLAGRVSDLLAKDGFAVGDVANAEYTGVTMSQVNATDTGDPAALAIAKKLGDLPVVYDPSLPPGNVSVTLAGDYNGPGLYSDDSAEAGAAEADSADAAGSGEVVGDEGGAPAPEPTTEPIDAGGNGPMCVN
nr:LCP family protein [Corynebacterium sp. TAE3-ERU12]